MQREEAEIFDEGPRALSMQGCQQSVDTADLPSSHCCPMVAVGMQWVVTAEMDNVVTKG